MKRNVLSYYSKPTRTMSFVGLRAVLQSPLPSVIPLWASARRFSRRQPLAWVLFVTSLWFGLLAYAAVNPPMTYDPPSMAPGFQVPDQEAK